MLNYNDLTEMYADIRFTREHKIVSDFTFYAYGFFPLNLLSTRAMHVVNQGISTSKSYYTLPENEQQISFIGTKCFSLRNGIRR